MSRPETWTGAHTSSLHEDASVDGVSTATASLLHHGLSATLVGAFEALADQLERDGRPRFPDRTLRELRRIVLCRTYSGACLELGWWLWSLWRGGGPDAALRVVYVDGLVNARRALAALAEGRLVLPPGTRIDGTQCEVVADSATFVLHLGRLPLWTALLELLVFIDPTVLRPDAGDELPGAIANRLQRVLYRFLAEHAQPLQQQRRLAAMLQWLAEQAPDDPAGAIDDTHIFAFWLDPPASAQDVVRLRTVAEGFFSLRAALIAGQRAVAAGHALAFEQLDQLLLVAEDAEQWLDPEALDLGLLCAPPRFLTAKAAQALEVLAHFPDVVHRLPLTLARWQVWGGLQARWLEAVKRRQGFDPEAVECMDYAAWCAELADWRGELGQMTDAGLGVLLHYGEVTQVLGQLVEDDVALTDAVRALPELAELTNGLNTAALPALRLRSPPLNQVLQRIERSLKNTTRAGFKGTEDFADAQAYRTGVAALKTLDGRICRMLAGAPHWFGNYTADRPIVLQRLTALHAGDAPRHEDNA
jgi:hypothetical protein